MVRNSLYVVVMGMTVAFGSWANRVLGQTVECATTSTTTSDAMACSGCPCKGDCDTPGIRNQYVPSLLGSNVSMRVRVNINYFNSAMAADIAAQRTKIVDDFAAYHIQLVVDTEYRADPGYQTIDDQAELEDMRTDWADPTKLNVYVAAMDVLSGSKGKAVLPWETDALTDQGGVLVNIDSYGGDKTTMTHEIGHALGLWHTHHGTNLGEMSDVHGTCSGGLCYCQCYESPDCPDCNVVGDFCGDTPPTPVNFECEDPGGEDTCSSYDTEWGETDYHNLMGVAEDSGSPPFCRNHFTTQQSQRMHCWSCDRLVAWIDSPDCNNNDMPDVCDITRGDSYDCDEDGIPDECQLGACCMSHTPNDCETITECACAYGIWWYGPQYDCGEINCFLAPNQGPNPEP